MPCSLIMPPWPAMLPWAYASVPPTTASAAMADRMILSGRRLRVDWDSVMGILRVVVTEP